MFDSRDVLVDSDWLPRLVGNALGCGAESMY